MLITPGFWIRHFGGLRGRSARKVWVEIYALLKLVLATGLLYFHLWNIPFISILSVYLLADVFISLGGYIFLRKFWQNPYSWNRSLILLFVNFGEYTSWFASLYLSGGLLKSQQGGVITGAAEALYFSIVTATTVGFGDITPIPGRGQFVVTLEILASLFFLVTVVSYFVSNMSGTEVDKPAD